MSKVAHFMKRVLDVIGERVLRVLDPGKDNRDVLSIQRSGAVQINTARILGSPNVQDQVRKKDKAGQDGEIEPVR